jgi:hypothetical protein
MGWWSPRRAGTLATQEWGFIDGYDYDDEQAEIKEIGIKPITANQQQVPMLDPSDPGAIPGVAPGQTVDKTPDKPAPKSAAPGASSNDMHNANRRNNPYGAGDSEMRKAFKQRQSNVLSRIWRRE